MTAADNDPLVHQLAELAKGLDTDNIPIILGGGMSLYLRQKFLSGRPGKRTEMNRKLTRAIFLSGLIFTCSKAYAVQNRKPPEEIRS
jgi:hypothetical protein